MEVIKRHMKSFSLCDVHFVKVYLTSTPVQIYVPLLKMKAFESITLFVIVQVAFCRITQPVNDDKEIKGELVMGPLFVNRNISIQGFHQLCPQIGKFKLNESCQWYLACGNDHLTIHKCANKEMFDGSTCSLNLNCTVKSKEGGKSELGTILDFVSFHQPKSKHDTGHKNNALSSKTSRISRTSAILNSLSFIKKQEYPEGQEFSCVNGSTTTTTFPYSCSHFLECISGKAFLRKCALGVFNPLKATCDSDPKVLAQCTTTTTTANNKQVMKSFLAVGLLKSRRRREAGRKCRAPLNYIQPHEKYCNKFEICSNGRITEGVCGLGAMFNPLSSVCDFPYNVDCESRLVDFASYECNKEHKYRAQHPENCYKFIECDGGNLHVKECPPSTAYNYLEEECDHVNKVFCRKPISLEHDEGHSYRRGRRESKLNLDCRLKITGNYIAPHPKFCDKFVECENSRIFVKDCGPGTVYNRELGQCDWAYNTRLPVPNDCSQYLQCERGHYAPKQCLGRTVYSQETKRCVYSFGNDCRYTPPIIPQS